MGEPRALKGHLPVLDGVRGLAVLVIMVYHFRAADLPRWLAGPIGIAWFGVDLFFVLSGFLITGILLDTRQSSRCLPVFWMRRVLRIFPLYFFALAAILILAPSEWLPAQSDQRFYWLYLNNWLNLLRSRDAFHLLGHFWSLAIEEQFYLAWPLVVWVLPPKWTLRVSAAGILLAVVARSAAVASGADAELVYRNTLLRLDALLAGSACSCLVRTASPAWLYSAARRGLYFAALGAGLVVVAVGSTHYQNQWLQLFGYPLMWFGSSCFVLACALQPGEWHWVSARPLRRMGQYSYGLYVWHWPIAYAMLHYWREWSLTGWWAAAGMQALGFVCSGALAWTSYRFLEEPILRLKRCFTLEEPRDQPDGRSFFNSAMSAGTTSKRSPTIP